MIVADTGAIIALIDADDAHHLAVKQAFERAQGEWVLPWAILAEVDYLLASHVGRRVELAFLRDVAEARFHVVWEGDRDIQRAHVLCEQYVDLGLGLVDSVVIAVAERLEADAIATLDRRHFGAVSIRGAPRLLP